MCLFSNGYKLILLNIVRVQNRYNLFKLFKQTTLNQISTLKEKERDRERKYCPMHN